MTLSALGAKRGPNEARRDRESVLGAGGRERLKLGFFFLSLRVEVFSPLFLDSLPLAFSTPIELSLAFSSRKRWRASTPPRSPTRRYSYRRIWYVKRRERKRDGKARAVLFFRGTHRSCSIKKLSLKSLDLDVDFDASVVCGTAAITLRATAAGAASSSGAGVSEAWLDSSALDVSSASASASSDGAAGEEPALSSSSSSFTLDPPHPVLGTRLRVPLEKPLTKEGQEATIKIHFSTTARGTALQWLSPAQTSGGRSPFLFSQCQAIHARSFVPCQDTPGAKVTYDARVTVPAGLTPRMSALDDEEKKPEEVDGKKTRFSFAQPVPLSPYLLALAVGELERRDLSPRCAVWAEPSVVEAAAFEFSETEDFLAAVEKASMRAFRWRRADLLVLPRSFPYGGMESLPTVFVTPTLIVGDRSQVRVVGVKGERAREREKEEREREEREREVEAGGEREKRKNSQKNDLFVVFF